MSAPGLSALLARKRLLIFDFDGTIVDSSPLHGRAFNEAFAAHGVAVDYEAIAGLPTEAAVDKVAAGAGLALSGERRADLIRDKRERARRLIAARLEPLDGSVDFIRGARGRFALALCTSASRATLELALGRIGLDGCFDPVITAEDVSNGKPEPEGFLKALAHHDARPSEALVLEDADSGLAAARAAGIDALRIGGAGGVGWADLNQALERLDA